MAFRCRVGRILGNVLRGRFDPAREDESKLPARTKHLRLRSAPVPRALAPRPVAGLPFQLVNEKGRYCQHRETAAPETFKRCRLRPKFQVDHSTPLACSKTQRTFSPTLSAPFERDNVFYRVRSKAYLSARSRITMTVATMRQRT